MTNGMKKWKEAAAYIHRRLPINGFFRSFWPRKACLTRHDYAGGSEVEHAQKRTIG
jgi:hypothetical protein